MAAPTHYLTKRDLLHGPKTSPKALVAAGRDYLAREAFSDALDFFEKARDAEAVKEIKRIALERGDSFLLARVERYDRILVAESDWERVAVTADKNGMSSMAVFARKRIAPPEAATPGVQPIEEAGEAAPEKK
ncbi:MAG: hypothetical protein HY291_15030 [Planctomycetes bacterium]|nr:hypothetical protein [Planctomycetota bacterium]